MRVEQFERLCEGVETARARQRQEKGRRRAPGGGRKAKLALEAQVLVMLMYYRLYVTQMLLGYLFDLDGSNVSRLIAELRPLLQAVLPLPAQEVLLFSKPAERRVGSLDELLAKHPDLKEVLIDATEQEIQKPKNSARRKSRYSGNRGTGPALVGVRCKKKRHTLKTQVTSTPGGLFLHLSRSIQGRVNDLTLLRGSGALHELPLELDVRLDRGYDRRESLWDDGIAQSYPERHFEQPHKARRNKPLDLVQKLVNQARNRARVRVENALAHPSASSS